MFFFLGLRFRPYLSKKTQNKHVMNDRKYTSRLVHEQRRVHYSSPAGVNLGATWPISGCDTVLAGPARTGTTFVMFVMYS